MSKQFWPVFKAFLMFIFAFIFVGQINAQVADQVVRVGVYDNPPKVYLDENQNWTGVFIDVLEYVAEQENWRLEFVSGTFQDGLDNLEQNRIDVMVDVAVSEDRQEVFTFNQQTVLSSWGETYVPKNSTIESISDLQNKRIGILQSSVYLDGPAGFKQHTKAFDIDTNLIEYPEYQHLFEALDSGNIDAAIVSRISGATAQDNYSNIKTTNIIFSPTELRFAFNPNNPSTPYLIKTIDSWLPIIKNKSNNNIYSSILEKHNLLGLNKQVEIQVLPEWVKYTLAILLIVILLSSIGLIGFKIALKRVAQALAARQKSLTRVIDNTPVILAAINKDGIITQALGQALVGLGIEGDNVVGQNAFDRYAHNKTITKRLRLAIIGEPQEFVTQENGHTYHVFATPNLINGNLKEVLVVAIDISADQKLRQAQQSFLSLVQHQLRTPPSAIKWCLEILAPDITPHLTPKNKSTWQMLLTESERLIKLANQFSIISETETGSFIIRSQDINAREFLTNLIESFRLKLDYKRLEVKINLDRIDTIHQDVSILEIIMEALLSNAIDYSNPATTIHLEAVKDSHHLTLSISNQGIPISNSEKARLFSKFYRGDQAAHHNPEGLGLSLYLSKLLVEAIDGEIWFEHDRGKTTFFVKIPDPIKQISS